MMFFTLMVSMFSRQGLAAESGNLALGKPVIASSESPEHPASKAVDGAVSRSSKWQAGTLNPPHVLEVDLQKYCSITEIKVHSGILDAEKRPDEQAQAAGFWSVKNFKMQYWDDANWSDFPDSEVHENRLTTASFKYETPVVTSRVRLVCDDGEAVSVMEIEVIGVEAVGMPAPPTFTSDLTSATAPSGAQRATLTIGDKVVGKTMKYVGYNQGYYLPGSNVSGWLEYSNVNSLRLWASLNAFAPASAVQTDSPPEDLQAFEARKTELRRAPEKNKYIKWDQLRPLFEKHDTSSTNAMVLNYALGEAKRLGLDVILQSGDTDFEDNWANKWKQWQRYYALAYHCAKTGGVEMFAMQNEPNHRNAGPMLLDQWIMGMRIVSDAVHCAVEDVNRMHGTKLTPKFVGPVTAGYNTEWWAGVARAMRTNYRGETVDQDLIQVFSTHSYNSPAAGYDTRVNAIRKVITDNHPAGAAPPIAYTEIGRWMNAYLIDKEETMDSPSLFTEWAGIYANNMKNGAYGMWAFKFANTVSGNYPRGIKSGHHFTWQGKRIVEDAYTNLALGKAHASSASDKPASLITDGDKSDASAWVSGEGDGEKWVEIDLGKSQSLGSAVVYTGSDGGVYTGPDRIRNFKLQSFANGAWADIPGAEEKNCKYTQVFIEFEKPMTAGKVRFITTDPGPLRLREIKLFAAADGPSDEPNFNISGIQRAGEVVRLFAKGFKDARPLLETSSSVADANLDRYTTFDETSGDYYMWLVNRSIAPYELALDLKALDVQPGVAVTAETVSPTAYGEVTAVIAVPESKRVELTMSPQSVMLLTIPKGVLALHAIPASASATVADATAGAGGRRPGSDEEAGELTVALGASNRSNNRVAYIHFELPKDAAARARRTLLRVNGKATGAANEQPYRLHVYAIPIAAWNEKTLNWRTAPLLDETEALIEHVGQRAFVAGQIAFDETAREHRLDVSAIVNKHAKLGLTFVLIRETRQLGDDADKGLQAIISSRDSVEPPTLEMWLEEKR